MHYCLINILILALVTDFKTEPEFKVEPFAVDFNDEYVTEPNECSGFEKKQPSTNELDHENNHNTEKPIKNSRKIAAMKRQKGEAYTNQAGKLIPAKVVNFGVLCSEGCRRKCSQMFYPAERKKIFSSYYSLNDENLKNMLLFKGISCRVPSRPKRISSRPKAATFMYTISIDNRTVPVCKKAFCSLYQIGMKKIKLLQEYIKDGLDAPKMSQRGKHTK